MNSKLLLASLATLGLVAQSAAISAPSADCAGACKKGQQIAAKDSMSKGSASEAKEEAREEAKDKTGKVSHVGGVAMYPSKNIIENASKSPIHKTLVAAVGAAGLVDTLQGAGPFTVFAPTDKAFAALPEGTVANLLKPENKSTLSGILTYHVVPGTVTAADLKKLIKDGKGSAVVKTVQGGTLTAKIKGGAVELTDAKGGMAKVSQADVMQSNGVIHVIDKVLMP